MPDKPGKTMAGPATFSFVPDRMSEVKFPVKHTSLYRGLGLITFESNRLNYNYFAQNM